MTSRDFLRLTSGSLAARTHARHATVINQTEAAADAVDRAITAMWSELLRILRTQKSGWHAHQAASKTLAGLGHRMVATTGEHLRRIADTTRQRTATDILRTVPARSLAYAAAQKRLSHDRRRRLSESRLLREDLAQHIPGAISLFFQPHTGEFGATDLLRFLRDPGSMSRAEQFEMFASILFPTPPKSAIDRIVYGESAGGLSWVQRLTAATRLATPAHVANVVSQGYAAGKTQQEIAKDLLPIVQNVRSSAKRIARTEGSRIATDIQMAAHEQLGDLVIGYRLLATNDQNVRPWHWARHNQIYYKEPAEGQKGMRQCPRPPMEPEDQAERPPGTPQVAWNCRCLTIPVLRAAPGVGGQRTQRPLAAGAAAMAE